MVAPGFIDLHQHAQDTVRYRVEVLDGTTTALELEGGTVDVDRGYDARAGTSIILHGVSIGHDQVRMQVMHDPGKDTPIGPAKSRAGTERRGIGLSKLHAHDALHTVLILCNTKSRPPANSPEAHGHADGPLHDRTPLPVALVDVRFAGLSVRH